MNRKEAKDLLPIIKAFSEGKEIEGLYKGTKSPWFGIKDMDFNEGIIFRIKPEPTYRPFKDGDECWETVQNEGFDWVKIKGDPTNLSVGIAEVNESNVVLSGSLSEEPLGYEEAFEKLTFVDGTPFGIKEE